MSVELGCLVCAGLCCLSPLVCALGVYMAVRDAVRDVKKEIDACIRELRAHE